MVFGVRVRPLCKLPFPLISGIFEHSDSWCSIPYHVQPTIFAATFSADNGWFFGCLLSSWVLLHCSVHFVCPTACKCSARCLAAWCRSMHHSVLLLLYAEFLLEGYAQFYLVYAAYLYQLTGFVCCILCNIA